ncbi:MAG: hypothetical protein OEW16_03815 [Gammaproteobacteria bacterium]|nr:hypothetical protein [Gammaproteobacteria bacterium]
MNDSITRTPNNRRSAGSALRRLWLLATVLGAITSASAFAGPQLGTIEECVESGTDLVALPGVPGGTLSARKCAACDSVRLTFDAGTRYFIGNEAVTYTRLLAAARKGPAQLDVFYRPETRVLTRLRLVAGGSSQ